LPLGLLFVSNVVNMLAGTNGLSAGMSFIATGLGTFAILNGKIEAALIAFGLAGALLGFLKYNWYPASILPGDSMTYLCGAGLFSAMVIGNMEKFGVFIFLPWFLEFFLKLRSGFRAHSWGTLEKGKLKPQHRKKLLADTPSNEKRSDRKTDNSSTYQFRSIHSDSSTIYFPIRAALIFSLSFFTVRIFNSIQIGWIIRERYLKYSCNSVSNILYLVFFSRPKHCSLPFSKSSLSPSFLIETSPSSR